MLSNRLNKIVNATNESGSNVFEVKTKIKQLQKELSETEEILAILYKEKENIEKLDVLKRKIINITNVYHNTARKMFSYKDYLIFINLEKIPFITEETQIFNIEVKYNSVLLQLFRGEEVKEYSLPIYMLSMSTREVAKIARQKGKAFKVEILRDKIKHLERNLVLYNDFKRSIYLAEKEIQKIS